MRFAILATLAAAMSAAAPEAIERIHRSAILIDTHNDVTSRTLSGWDIGPRDGKGHTDLARLREGGVGAVFFAVYVPAAYARRGGAARRALEVFDTVRHDIVGRYPRDFALALTAEDIEAAHRAGKVAALMGVEGGHAIEDSLRVLRSFHALGARYMTLTHSNTNNWADSSGDLSDPAVKHHGGLTAFGRQVIAEMNRLGMLVDVAHVSDKTFWDVLAVSRAPVFSSHSSCRALSNIPRNMTDEMIAAMASKGGVIQINFGCEFLSQKSADGSPWINTELRRKMREQPGAWAGYRMPRAALADVVAHIDHVVKIAGIDAVGIGSDFDGVECTPEGLDDVSKFPNLTRALLEKGYTAEQIGKIYGGNTLRLMRAVQAAAGASAP